jgi:hypothetical protein
MITKFACPYYAIKYGKEVGDSISSIDFTDLRSDDYVGLGHFIDMNAPPPAPLFDDRSGKLPEAAGPERQSDLFETFMVAGMNMGGIRVNYDLSNGPKNYEIILGASGQTGSDFHQNSVQRGKAEWEALTVSSTQATPLDNLAMYGWINLKNAPTSREPRRGRDSSGLRCKTPASPRWRPRSAASSTKLRSISPVPRAASAAASGKSQRRPWCSARRRRGGRMRTDTSSA